MVAFLKKLIFYITLFHYSLLQLLMKIFLIPPLFYVCLKWILRPYFTLTKLICKRSQGYPYIYKRADDTIFGQYETFNNECVLQGFGVEEKVADAIRRYNLQAARRTTRRHASTSAEAGCISRHISLSRLFVRSKWTTDILCITANAFGSAIKSPPPPPLLSLTHSFGSLIGF